MSLQSLEKHDLLHELPESKETIHSLKMNNNHFSRLFDEYHEVDHEVHRIETGAENTSDEYLEARKKERLNLKDQLFAMIKEHEAATS
ncbi:MAG: GTP-binding protein [Gammaproteobacteria bacterium]|nr:MAG: GTP-binding protein [Gammaproteobacteria bacterium]